MRIRSRGESRATTRQVCGASPDSPAALPVKALGLLFTEVALSLGAPFWFDVFNKFIVVLSTIEPREKSPEEASKDR